MGGSTFTYNTDHLAEKGIDPASIKTWDDLAAAGKELVQWDGDDLVRAGVAFSPYISSAWVTGIRQLGGSYFDPETGKFNLTSPEAIEALKVIDDLLKVHKVDDITKEAPSHANMTGYGAPDGFPEGKASITNFGSWIVSADPPRPAGLNAGVFATPRMGDATEDIELSHNAVHVLSRRLADDPDKKAAAEFIVSQFANPALFLPLADIYGGSVIIPSVAQDPSIGPTGAGAPSSSSTTRTSGRVRCSRSTTSPTGTSPVPGRTCCACSRTASRWRRCSLSWRRTPTSWSRTPATSSVSDRPGALIQARWPPGCRARSVMEAAMLERPLVGRVAVVTGAGTGLGAAIARRLAEAGADVALHFRSHAGSVEAVADACRRVGVRALVLQADFATDPDGAARIVDETAAGLGRVDILVNNAAQTTETAPFEAMTRAFFEETLAVNVTAPFLATQAAARHMVDQGSGGRIVNIGSVHGRQSAPGYHAYETSKGADLGAHVLVRGGAGRAGYHGELRRPRCHRRGALRGPRLG